MFSDKYIEKRELFLSKGEIRHKEKAPIEVNRGVYAVLVGKRGGMIAECSEL